MYFFNTEKKKCQEFFGKKREKHVDITKGFVI